MKRVLTGCAADFSSVADFFSVGSLLVAAAILWTFSASSHPQVFVLSYCVLALFLQSGPELSRAVDSTFSPGALDFWLSMILLVCTWGFSVTVTLFCEFEEPPCVVLGGLRDSLGFSGFGQELLCQAWDC